MIVNARHLIEITDWVGGGGNKPVTGYLAESGIVSVANNAIDFLGAQGPAGNPGGQGNPGEQGDPGGDGSDGRPGFGFEADLVVDGAGEYSFASAATHLTIRLNETGNAYLLTLLVGTVIWVGDGRYTVTGVPTMVGDAVRVPVSVQTASTAVASDDAHALFSQSPFSVPVSVEILTSAALGEPTAAKFNQIRNFMGSTYACRRSTHAATTQASTWTAWTLLQDISAFWAAESGLRFRGINNRSSGVANAHAGDVSVTPGGTWTVYRIVGGIGWFHLDPPDYFLGPLVDEADATNHAVRNNNTAIYDHRVWYSSAFVAGTAESFAYYWLNTEPVYDVKGKLVAKAVSFPSFLADARDNTVAVTFELADGVTGGLESDYVSGEAAVDAAADFLYLSSLRPPGVMGFLVEVWGTALLGGQTAPVFQQIDESFMPWGPGSSYHSHDEDQGGVATFLKIHKLSEISMRLRNWDEGWGMRMEFRSIEIVSSDQMPDDLEVRIYYWGLFKS